MTKIGTFIVSAFAAAMLWVAPAAANEVTAAAPQITRVADVGAQVTLADGIDIVIGGRRPHDPYYDPYYGPYRQDRWGRCFDDWGYQVPCYPHRRPPVVVVPIPFPGHGHHGHDGHRGHDHRDHGHHRR